MFLRSLLIINQAALLSTVIRKPKLRSKGHWLEPHSGYLLPLIFGHGNISMLIQI